MYDNAFTKERNLKHGLLFQVESGENMYIPDKNKQSLSSRKTIEVGSQVGYTQCQTCLQT